MIVSITPNPAVDVGGVVDEIIPDEKTYVRQETRNPGGNSINSARVIERLGVPVVATGFAGGSAGSELCGLLSHEGIQHDFVEIEGNTRVNMTVTSQRTNRQTRLSFSGPAISASEEQGLMRKLGGYSFSPPSMALLGGSFPPGFETEHARAILSYLDNLNIPAVVDVPTVRLKHLISENLFMIKPNLHEFQQLVGNDCMSRSEIIEAARKLNRSIDIVCVSSVERGALFVTRQGVWFGEGPLVDVKSTVGAGDSMVGGIVTAAWKSLAKKSYEDYDFSLFSDSDLREMLRWGMAGALACISVEGTVPGSAQSMQELTDRIQITQIC